MTDTNKPAPSLLNSPTWEADLRETIACLGYEDRLDWAWQFLPSGWTIVLGEESKGSADPAPELRIEGNAFTDCPDAAPAPAASLGETLATLVRAVVASPEYKAGNPTLEQVVAACHRAMVAQAEG